jgi:hypothetical protein
VAAAAAALMVTAALALQRRRHGAPVTVAAAVVVAVWVLRRPTVGLRRLCRTYSRNGKQALKKRGAVVRTNAATY